MKGLLLLVHRAPFCESNFKKFYREYKSFVASQRKARTSQLKMFFPSAKKFHSQEKTISLIKTVTKVTLDYYIHASTFIKDQVSVWSLNKLVLSFLLRLLERKKLAKRRIGRRSFGLLKRNEEGDQEGSIFLRSSEGLFREVRGF